MRSGLIESRPAGEQERSYPPVYAPSAVQQARVELQPTRAKTRGARGQARSTTIRPVQGWMAFVFLTIAVYVVVISFIQAGWVDGSVVLLYSTAAGLVVGLGVAKVTRFPQSLLHLSACLAGYWLSVWLASEVALHIQWQSLLVDLRALIGGSLPSTLQVNNQAIFLFYLTFLSFFLGYFGAWLIYRARLPWLVGVVYSSIMLVNLQAAHSDLSMTLVALMAALLLLIGQMQLNNQLARWTEEGLHTDRGWMRNITGRFMRITSLFMAAIILLCLVLPVFDQPPAGVTFWYYLDNAWNRVLSNPSAIFNPASLLQPGSGSGAAPNFFGDQLPIAGSVNLPSGEVLYYTTTGAGSQQGRYLESVAYDQFDGHTWTTSTSNGASQQYNPGATLPVESQSGVSQISTSVTIAKPPQGSKAYIFAPLQPKTFSVSMTLYGSGIISAWAQQSSLTAGEKYQVISLMPVATEQQLSATPLLHSPIAAWQGDPNFNLLKNFYLEEPPDLSQTVITTAHAWTQGATNVYEAMNMLVAHLSDQTRFTYSIDNQAVPGNIDAVTWLLQSRRGFCTYYATAMAMMARVLGVPARVVSGFNQGYYDAKRHEWVVIGEDAHSWTQVYFPNMGWINFDPTPGFSLNPTAASQPTPTLTATPTRPGQTVTPTGTKHLTPTTGPGGGRSGGDPAPQAFGGSQMLFLSFSLVVLVIAMLALAIAAYRYRENKRLEEGTLIAVTFWRLSRLAALAGHSPGKSQTPYEYTYQLARRFPQARDALWRITHLFVRERWGAPQHAPAPGEEQTVEQLWPRLRAIMLRALIFRQKP
ncbi:MAG TPA: transglutaminase domain-containing protein [Ktedonobacteraceae bacterium]|nr:transglutaminase domain-containing protein [Ktedonobacteraceae bacterium]